MRLLIDKEHGGGREKESAEDNVGPAAEQNTVHFGFVFFTKIICIFFRNAL